MNVPVKICTVSQPMRFVPVILVFALLTACSRKQSEEPKAVDPVPVPSAPVPAQVTEQEIGVSPQGVIVLKSTQAPYTGLIKTRYPDGKPRAEVAVVDGLKHGGFKEFYPTGGLMEESQWEKNLRVGERTEYYPSGKKLAVEHFEAGQRQGERREWYEDGKVHAVMQFEKGQPVGVREEWDAKGVAKYEIPFTNGQPGERKLVSNTSLTLDEKERKYLWDTEHHGTLLRKFGFKPFVQTLEWRDANLIAKHLHQNFKALVPKEEAQVTRPIGGAGEATRWDLAGENRKPLDRGQFLQWLQELLGPYHKDPKAKISLMQFAPLKRYDLEGVWRGNVQMKFFGEIEAGKPRELVLYIDVEVNKPDEEGLKGGNWLMAAEVTRLKESRATHYLMEDVAAKQGINVDELNDNWKQDPDKSSANTGGVFTCDFNHDGAEDFLLTDAKLPKGYKLYQGSAGGQFKDVTSDMGLDAAHAHIGVWVDIDGDSWEDLLLNTGQVYRNVKGTKFEEVTDQSNLRAVGDLEKTGSFTYHAIADYDGDGLLDIYLFRVDSQPLKGTWIDGKVGHNAKNQLLRNKGNWQFEDVTAATGTDGGARSTFSSVWFDANNDQRPDLYVIHEYGNGLLLVNQEDGTFKAQELADRAADFGSMGLASGDFNNDGRIDLYVASMYSKSGSRVIGNLKPNSYNDEVMSKLKRMVAGSQLYQNNGDLNFEPVGKKYDVIGIGWAYAPTLADLDNDGFLDLHATTGFISRTRDKPDG